MSVTQEQIEKLSKNLSKINVDNERITKDVNGILNYIELLNEVDTTGVKPTVSVVESENNLRSDKESEKVVKPSELLGCSNQKIVANQIAVSNIMS